MVRGFRFLTHKGDGDDVVNYYWWITRTFFYYDARDETPAKKALQR